MENKENQVVPVEQQQNTALTKASASIADGVISKVSALEKTGFIMPFDFNHVNAIKASMLIIQDLQDKNGVPALNVCTPNSIANALFKMCVFGLDASKKQAYFIVRGKELCLEPSYFGNIVRAKRASTKYEPIANIIYEDDEFIHGINPETGRKKVIKHESKLENQDKPIVGAYAFITYEDGTADVEIMTKKQIDTAWAQSSSTQMKVHKAYPDQMAKRTVINRATKILINSDIKNAYVPDEFSAEGQPIDISHEDVTYTEFEETPKAEIAETATPPASAEPVVDAKPEAQNKPAKELF